MKLTRTERWILSNQLQLLKIIDTENKDYYETTQEIVNSGYEYLYGDCIQFIYPDDQIVTEAESALVLDILSMFRAITQSLDRIEDKSNINLDQLRFDGFDGNNETNFYSFAKFFCTEYGGGRFQEIGTGLDNFNSHFPVLDTYKRMLDAWNQCKDRYRLSKDELIQIATAAIHPSRR